MEVLTEQEYRRVLIERMRQDNERSQAEHAAMKAQFELQSQAISIATQFAVAGIMLDAFNPKK